MSRRGVNVSPVVDSETLTHTEPVACRMDSELTAAKKLPLIMDEHLSRSIWSYM